MAARGDADRAGINDLDGCAALVQQLARRGDSRDGLLMRRTTEKFGASFSCTVLATSMSFFYGSKVLAARSVDVWDGTECEPGHAGVCAASRRLGRNPAFV